MSPFQIHYKMVKKRCCALLLSLGLFNHFILFFVTNDKKSLVVKFFLLIWACHLPGSKQERPNPRELGKEGETFTQEKKMLNDSLSMHVCFCVCPCACVCVSACICVRGVQDQSPVKACLLYFDYLKSLKADIKAVLSLQAEWRSADLWLCL